jgi:hypothetical protein
MLALYSTTWYAKKAKSTNEGTLLHSFLVGSKEKPPMKKEATPKRKGLKTKTSDGKSGNPKMQGAQNKGLR